MKRLLVREVRYRMTTGIVVTCKIDNIKIILHVTVYFLCLYFYLCAAEALMHPFITGAQFFPRYASMQAADFDPPTGREAEEEGAFSLAKNADKAACILAR
jgi:hypothetical protein